MSKMRLIGSLPEAPSSSSVSMWVRVSDKPPTSSSDNIICSEDLEVSATSPRKCIPHHPPQKQQDYQASHMEMDINEEEDALDGSSDEGCLMVDVSERFIVVDPPVRPKGKEMLFESNLHKLCQRQKQIDYGKNTLVKGKEMLFESNMHKLCQRQKQIDYGKNTLVYERYLELVPRNQRKKYVHPQTPNIKQVCSKGSWDGQVKKWRRRLHEFDPPMSENEETPQQFDFDNGDDGLTDHSQDEKDATTTYGSEGNPKEEAGGISAIYDDWDIDDAMEP